MLSKLQTTLFYLTLLSKFALYVQISGLAIHCLVHATLSPPLSVVQKKIIDNKVNTTTGNNLYFNVANKTVFWIISGLLRIDNEIVIDIACSLL